MHIDLSGKSALVTGASRGIGRAIADLLHAHGCRVALNGRNATDLEVATNALKGSIGIVGDVANVLGAKQVVADALEALGGLDILICNVGSGRSTPPGQESNDEWLHMFALNLWSTTNTVEAAKEALIASRGSIVCISSICGLEVIPGAPVTYSAAKAALNAFVRGIARPLGRKGVRINAVAPGNILFEGSIWSKKLAEDSESVELMLHRDVSLGRLGSPDEVANLVLYMASPLSGFATGQIWTIDGGQTHS